MLSGTFVPGVTFCMSQTKRKKKISYHSRIIKER
jgi:hypothetical protein